MLYALLSSFSPFFILKWGKKVAKTANKRILGSKHGAQHFLVGWNMQQDRQANRKKVKKNWEVGKNNQIFNEK